MAIGPVEYMVVAFPGSKFRGDIVPALAELVDAGTVRIIDLAFVSKHEDGTVVTFELDEEESGGGDAIEKLHALVGELVNEDDLASVGELLAPGTSAALLVWEDVWAAKLAAAIRKAGGNVLEIERVPHAAVMEAIQASGVQVEQA